MKHETTTKTEHDFCDSEDNWLYTVYFVDGVYDCLEMPDNSHWMSGVSGRDIDEAEKIIKQIRKLQGVEQTAKNKLGRG